MALSILKDFLKRNYTPGKPLLLGLSGGADSLALLSLLLECAREFSIELHLVHVDHGWREESGEQADQLRALATELKLPFHLKKLALGQTSEEVARRERLNFFSQLFSTLQAQALLLAHHADDQGETVLKRVLEGASLFALGAMQQIALHEGMVIWRPLLSVRKAELANWSKMRGLEPFDDSTNRDRRFLRARMRTEILPSLSKSFGKEVGKNLLRLGETASEINEYLEEQTQPYFAPERLIIGPFGTLWDLSTLFPLKSLELKYALKKFFVKESISLSHSSFEQICLHLQAQNGNRKFPLQQQMLYVDRGRLFLLKKELPTFPVNTSLQEGVIENGNWEWNISFHSANKNFPPISDWRDLWKGKVRFSLPHQSGYQLVKSNPQALFPRSNAIKWWWGKHCVPAFLREILPLISWKGKIYYEFLSGKSQYILESNEALLIEVALKNRE